MLPILFTLHAPWGAQPLYSFGVMLAVALIAGYALLMRVGAREPGMNPDLLGNAYIVAALCGIAGARALYVWENGDLLEESGARWFQITSGGVSGYGALVGGLIGLAVYTRIKRASLATLADAATPSLALGVMVTRIGSYLYGSDFGTVLEDDAPGWLKRLGTFPHWHYDDLHVFGSPAFLHHVDRYALPRTAAASLPVHPTQLYEALSGLVLLGFALWLRPRRRFAGQVALSVAIAYGISRFLFEYLRDDPERAYSFGYSWTQLISLALVPTCAVVYSVLRGNARRAR